MAAADTGSGGSAQPINAQRTQSKAVDQPLHASDLELPHSLGCLSAPAAPTDVPRAADAAKQAPTVNAPQAAVPTMAESLCESRPIALAGLRDSSDRTGDSWLGWSRADLERSGSANSLEGAHLLELEARLSERERALRDKEALIDRQMRLMSLLADGKSLDEIHRTVIEISTSTTEPPKREQHFKLPATWFGGEGAPGHHRSATPDQPMTASQPQYSLRTAAEQPKPQRLSGDPLLAPSAAEIERPDSSLSVANKPVAPAQRRRPAPLASEIVLAIHQKLQAASYTAGGRDFAKLFRQLDRDNSGAISADELRRCIRRELRVPVPLISDKEIAALFAMLDADESGEVELAELTDFLQNGPPLTVGLINVVRTSMRDAAFSLAGDRWERLMLSFDRDCNGTIDVSEFRRAIRRELKLGLSQITERMIEQLFSLLDADSSGTLDLNELVRFVKDGPDVIDLTRLASISALRPTAARAEGSRSAATSIGVKRTPKDVSLESQIKIHKQLQSAAYSAGGQDWDRLFRAIDTDHSGSISQSEFRRCLRRTLRLSVSAVSDSELASLFAMLDSNDRGSVDIAEFREFLQQGPSISYATLRDLHRRMRIACQTREGVSAQRLFEFTERREGVIKVSDLLRFTRRVLNRGASELSDGMVAQFFAILDTSQRGTLAVDDIDRFLARMPTQDSFLAATKSRFHLASSMPVKDSGSPILTPTETAALASSLPALSFESHFRLPVPLGDGLQTSDACDEHLRASPSSGTPLRSLELSTRHLEATSREDEHPQGGPRQSDPTDVATLGPLSLPSLAWSHSACVRSHSDTFSFR